MKEILAIRGFIYGLENQKCVLHVENRTCSRPRRRRAPIERRSAICSQREFRGLTPAPLQCNRRSAICNHATIAVNMLTWPLFASLTSATESLPSGYEETARSLISVLRDSIEADLSGAPEQEVRRKADPAKDLVRRFFTKWKNVAVVQNDESYHRLTEAIQDLGKFYTKRGQRARLEIDIGNDILSELDAAEAALPPVSERKNMFPF